MQILAPFRRWLFGLILSLTPLVAQADPASTNRPPAQTNSAPALEVGENYQPNPQDKFLFRIEEDPNKGSEPEVRNVSALYEIQFTASRGTDTPINLNVRGKTIAEIKKELKAKLDEDYYQNATVLLKLHDQYQRPGKVYVTGTLRGQVTLLPGEQKTVLKAILELGGESDYANLKKVKLFRLNPDTNKEDITIIDVDAMLKGKSRQNDKVLQDGDRIEVPEKGFIIK